MSASQRVVEDVRRIYVKGVSMKIWVSADDIADAALFQSSPAAAKISGMALPVDDHTETITA